MKKEIKEKVLGYCAVDTGQILICDPCYIDNEWEPLVDNDNDEIFKPEHKGKFNYGGCCQATMNNGGQLELGVAVSSGFGDGVYPVVAKIKNYGTKKRPDWRVKEAVIKFIED